MSSAAHDPDCQGYSSFDQFITADFGICRNCFARTHEIVAEYDPTRMKKSLRGTLKNDVVPTTDALPDYIPDMPAASCRRTMCGECGSNRRTILKRPVRKSTALSYARNLTERVAEIDALSLDSPDALVNEVERLKSDGTYSSDGNYLFDRAFNAVVSQLPAGKNGGGPA